MEQAEKTRRFAALHEREGAFIIPNPWDAASARLLEALGFEALATTSSGFAMTLGRLDGQVTLDEKVAHIQLLSSTCELPISADLEDGFGDKPEAVAATIGAAAAAGASGGSIEDWANHQGRIHDFALAVERIQAAVEEAHKAKTGFVLTARAENQLRDVDDLDDTIRRLQAYEAAGADVLYAPGLRSLEEVERVSGALSKPLNVLAPKIPKASVEELADAGAKRISVGGALAYSALAALVRGGREMLEEGRFSWLGEIASGGDIRKMMSS